MHTNYQNLTALLVNYTPKSFGFITEEERFEIKRVLQLKDMDVIDLRNTRDFVVLFFSRKEKASLADMDKMSAIVSVIDAEIIKKGGNV